MENQILTFNRMTSDVADKYMKEGDYKLMVNCRPNNINAKGGGVVENIQSNEPINTLVFGESVEYIGGCADNKRNAIISFYSGLQTLYITSISVESKEESFLLKTTQLNHSKRVTHSGVMDDYLFWIDGDDKLRKFNINDATSVVNGISAVDLLFDKQPPLLPPTVIASYDNSFEVNNIRNTIFQYSYSYKYKDGEQSSWSPISKSIVPESTGNKDVIFPNNRHTITINSGGSNVDKILIAARKGETRDFVLIDTLDKEEETIGDNIQYQYSFYNDKATTGLVQADVLTNTFNPYYYFSSMAIANDNFIALGGVKDGLENTDVSLSIDYRMTTTAGRSGGFKTASTHQFALLFRDDNGRTAGILSPKDVVVPSYPKIKNADNTKTINFRAVMDWSVSGLAPMWAKTMSLCYLGNTTMSYFVQHIIGDIYDRTDYTYIDISPLNLASQAGSTVDITAQEINIEPYEWQKGDRIRFLTNESGALLAKEIDVDIRGYVPELTDVSGKVLFKETIYIDKIDWASDSIGKYSEYEIYRPKKDFNDKVYYEIAEVFDVINGVIQTQTGTITTGDIWKRERAYDTRNLGLLESDRTWEYSNYGGEQVFIPMFAAGEVSGLNSVPIGAENFSFYVAPEDVTVTIEGSFKYTSEWDKTDKRPRFYLYISRPGSNNNEFIYLPFTDKKITPSESYLDAAISTGTISYTKTLPKTSRMQLAFSREDKGRFIIIKPFDLNMRVMVVNEEDKDIDFWVEDKNYSDYFESNEHSKGRVYTELEDKTEGRVLNDIVTTGKYFAGTEIDETNKIDSTVTHIPYHYGNIEALRVVGNVLKCLTPTKEISMYLGREQYVDGTGSIQTSLSSNKIGAINVPTDDYGTRNPESTMIDARSMYYYDIKNAAIVSSNPNGRVNVGDYGMKTRLREITGRLKSATSYSVYIGYNDKNEEVICSFIYDGVQETIVFAEASNYWSHELTQSNEAGDSVQGYMHIGEFMLEYIGGAYIHEGGTDKLNFFGHAKEAKIIGVINKNPINTKVLQTMNYTGNDKWHVVIDGESTNTNPNGTQTQIPLGRQEYKEGAIFCDIPMNLKRKNGTINKLLYATGDPMRAKVATITMTNTNTNPVQLDNVVVNYIPSTVL